MSQPSSLIYFQERKPLSELLTNMPKYPMAPGEEIEDKTEAEASIIYRDREEAKMRHSRKYRDYRATTYDLGEENIHFNFLWPPPDISNFLSCRLSLSLVLNIDFSQCRRTMITRTPATTS